jgi:hypothetical protein
MSAYCKQSAVRRHNDPLVVPHVTVARYTLTAPAGLVSSISIDPA